MWQLPEKWISYEADTFNKTEISNITAKIATEKIEKMINKEREEEEDSDDDLNGWYYKKKLN